MRIDAAAVKARVYMPDLLPIDIKRVKTGRESLRAQCPIHGSERLSMGMAVMNGQWWFTCWSCGEAGDSIAFVMALDRCDFRSALARLAGELGPLLAGPAPKRHRPALLLVCDGRGCGATLEVEAADRPYVGHTVAVAWDLRAGRWYCPRCMRSGARP
jgi:hypothetical protein